MAKMSKRAARWPGRASLRRRVEVLEQEVQECRELNLRLAELTDVVMELLVPLSRRDEEQVAEHVRAYLASVSAPQTPAQAPGESSDVASEASDKQ